MLVLGKTKKCFLVAYLPASFIDCKKSLTYLLTTKDELSVWITASSKNKCTVKSDTQ